MKTLAAWGVIELPSGRRATLYEDRRWRSSDREAEDELNALHRPHEGGIHSLLPAGYVAVHQAAEALGATVVSPSELGPLPEGYVM